MGQFFIEYVIPGVILIIFGAFAYGSSIMVDEKKREEFKKQNKGEK